VNNEYFEKYGEPPCYADIEPYWKDWKMNDKRSYRDILASVETHFIYINNHLKNIDSHMGKINDTNLKQEVKIIRNKDRIGLLFKIIGGLLLILAGGIITGAITYLQGLW